MGPLRRGKWLRCFVVEPGTGLGPEPQRRPRQVLDAVRLPCEAAEALGISVRQLDRLVDAEKLRPIRLLSNDLVAGKRATPVLFTQPNPSGISTMQRGG